MLHKALYSGLHQPFCGSLDYMLLAVHNFTVDHWRDTLQNYCKRKKRQYHLTIYKPIEKKINCSHVTTMFYTALSC